MITHGEEGMTSFENSQSMMNLRKFPRGLKRAVSSDSSRRAHWYSD
jgi:hypothetical protein